MKVTVLRIKLEGGGPLEDDGQGPRGSLGRKRKNEKIRAGSTGTRKSTSGLVLKNASKNVGGANYAPSTEISEEPELQEEEREKGDCSW